MPDETPTENGPTQKEQEEQVIAVNVHAPVLDIYHKDLDRVDEYSKFRSKCPACKLGVLTTQRHPHHLTVMEHDNCTLCGQRVKYCDVESIQAEAFEDKDRFQLESGYKSRTNKARLTQDLKTFFDDVETGTVYEIHEKVKNLVAEIIEEAELEHKILEFVDKRVNDEVEEIAGRVDSLTTELERAESSASDMGWDLERLQDEYDKLDNRLDGISDGEQRIKNWALNICSRLNVPVYICPSPSIGTFDINEIMRVCEYLEECIDDWTKRLAGAAKT